jgi:3'(2'), 5'-bisphosphate nucleotidase
MEQLLLIAVDAAIQAGRAILNVYETDFVVEHKADDSPLTLADRRSHQILVAHLKPAALPILSEEGHDLPYGERRAWQTFWLLDPLDGTKEFVKRNGEFTVNIALIRDGRPVMGVIYVPVQDVLYFGAMGKGAYKMTGADGRITPPAETSARHAEQLEALFHASQRLPIPSTTPTKITVVGSRSHSTPEVQQIVDDLKVQHGDVELISAGSSLKICMVAEGRAHLYPRTGPTMEWDTAAGQAIAEAAGARMLVFDTDNPLRYNKENLRNPWFVVKSAVIDNPK